MCVIGAGRRAARGETAAQILGALLPGPARSKTSRASCQPSPAPRAVSSIRPAAAEAGRSHPSYPSHPSYRRRRRPSLIRALVARRLPHQPPEIWSGWPGEAQTRLAARLGVAAAPLTIRLHASLDGFRRATGQPWWVSAQVRGREIDLAPVAAARSARRSRTRGRARGGRGARGARPRRSPRLGPRGRLAVLHRAAATPRPRGESDAPPTPN